MNDLNQLRYLLMVLAKRVGGVIEIDHSDFQRHGYVMDEELVIYENPALSKIILEVVKKDV